jgi:hypothetical protein
MGRGGLHTTGPLIASCGGSFGRCLSGLSRYGMVKYCYGMVWYGMVLTQLNICLDHFYGIFLE